ncbi:Uncharacterised protein [Mycobacteroides abscessus subsp. abscessus]|nr:Uncharacterised protein [Mycobacteroides abscessus subsp. abscessus]
MPAPSHSVGRGCERPPARARRLSQAWHCVRASRRGVSGGRHFPRCRSWGWCSGRREPRCAVDLGTGCSSVLRSSSRCCPGPGSWWVPCPGWRCPCYARCGWLCSGCLPWRCGICPVGRCGSPRRGQPRSGARRASHLVDSRGAALPSGRVTAQCWALRGMGERRWCPLRWPSGPSR